MHRQKKPVGTGALLLILLAAGPPFLAAQTQAVTRTTFESSTPEGYAAVTLATSGRVWGVPAKYTSDSDEGAVAYMLLGMLKGCEFANAATDRGSKVYVRTRALGTLSRVGEVVTEPLPPQTRACASNALGSSHGRFAH